MKLDQDLASIQETRRMLHSAAEAQKAMAALSQQEIDAVTKTVAVACEKQAEVLGKMACEETGFGLAGDKAVKNRFGSREVYEYMKDMKTVGIISVDEVAGIWEVATPVGVIAALVPSTNPTSTTMFKALIALKTGCALVISPHPSAMNCIYATVEVIRQALEQAGAPQDAVQCLKHPTPEGTAELMSHAKTALILATGGSAMVRAAYRSGTPAIGVGPGNGAAFIHRTANIPGAVGCILRSKTFDYGTICASEQSIIVEHCMEAEVCSELKRQGARFLTTEEAGRLAKLLFRQNGSINPAIVGRSAETIADLAGIQTAPGTKVLIARETGVGKGHPYSYEKLCPVLGYYQVEDWREACSLSAEILRNEGVGHTMALHCEDREVIRQFALGKPVSRLLVNTPAALGGIGATTGLLPSLTLGCGAIGGSATSDNVGPQHLLNIRRVAFGKTQEQESRIQARQDSHPAETNRRESVSAEQVAIIARRVLAELNNTQIS